MKIGLCVLMGIPPVRVKANPQQVKSRYRIQKNVKYIDLGQPKSVAPCPGLFSARLS